METFEKKKIKTMKKEVDRFFRKDIEITFFVNSNQPSYFFKTFQESFPRYQNHLFARTLKVRASLLYFHINYQFLSKCSYQLSFYVNCRERNE